MTTDITGMPRAAPVRSQEPLRSVALSPTDRADVPNLHLPGSGEKLPPATQQSATPADKLEKAVKQLNEYVQNVNRDLQFSIDKESGLTVIKVIDSKTKEVIRQFPMEEVLTAARNISHSHGLLIKAKA
jgi:flagellar protein FlaG